MNHEEEVLRGAGGGHGRSPLPPQGEMSPSGRATGSRPSTLAPWVMVMRASVIVDAVTRYVQIFMASAVVPGE
ncbi:hypothetical protein BDN72DRAFT_850229 [Pluteus cervinus]|uniref:Uncharacterized protein n=1 Tax=Pluteus cervinus TaxID=181527 RepID=A0ACD3A595_9AGAR|nr:hypothetical protein BDN72DRAFT_850229 [Pluteus cervinus]